MSGKNQRILLYLGHPAHYHNLKVVAAKLRDSGSEVLFVARQKDVLFDLIKNSSIETIFLPARKSNTKIGLVWNILQREWKMLKIVRQFRPNIMAGTDLVIAHIGKITGIPSVLINEDDLDQIPLFARWAVRFCDIHLAPAVCRVKGYERQTRHYNSYHELSYLHPDVFTPDKSELSNYIDPEAPYFILRFAQLTAHHDAGKTGISDEIAQQLIELLSPLGRVYITSERPLSEGIEPFRINFPPTLMHHALAYAEMYIGDSQTMAAEAAVLGTPSIRFNDFVGKLSYLNELEERFQLTWGIPANQPDFLIEKTKQLIADKTLKNSLADRRKRMLSEKENLSELWFQFLQNYRPGANVSGFHKAV